MRSVEKTGNVALIGDNEITVIDNNMYSKLLLQFKIKMVKKNLTLKVHLQA